MIHYPMYSKDSNAFRRNMSKRLPPGISLQGCLSALAYTESSFLYFRSLITVLIKGYNDSGEIFK